MDISLHRPSTPEVICAVCHRRPEEFSSTGLHINLPPTKHGIVLIQVKCHGEKQNIAATFRWIKDHPHYIIFAFAPSTEDYGMKDLTMLDGFQLPESLKECAYQIEDAKSTEDIANNYETKMMRVIDEVFEQAIRREQEFPWGHERIGTTDDAALQLRQDTYLLNAVLERSEKEAVSTSEITDKTARLANLCQRIFLSFGTPRVRPKKMIDDIYDNAATKPTKHLDCVGTEGCKASVESTHLIGEQ